MGRAFEVRKEAMAKTAVKKAKVYSKYGKEIYMEAKNGVPDPEMNLNLKRIIERARQDQVPNDVINRAIEKAKGNSVEDYHAARYEGFGPNGSTFIVECLTDNDNRSVSEVRNAFTKSNGKMGVSGSVIHGYDHVGVLGFQFENEELILETLFEEEIDLEDIETVDGQMTVIVNPKDLYKAKDAIESVVADIEFDITQLTYLPHDTVELNTKEDQKMFEKLIDMLDDCEDVQDVYHNIVLKD
ncbi:MAG: YebC/PmpR family DNA-binding transcriptional regulator [Erysipelothrix sp.]|nr:YebC/PmpR family DNA-binding transcriptional regulator [Erysipelothrix sp.]